MSFCDPKSIAAVVCFSAFFGLASTFSPGASPGLASAAEHAQTRIDLVIADRYNVPVAELSGLSMAPAFPPEGAEKERFAISLYAVGDVSYQVARLDIGSLAVHDDTQPAQSTIRIEDVAPALGKKGNDASQWEAIAADGLDTICMLSEARGEISCIDHSLRTSRGNFELDVSSIGYLDSAWNARANSRGEGMILMKRGHVLILKEKDPSMLVEFGPAGDLPMGYSPSSFLRKGEAFAGLQAVPSNGTDGISHPSSPVRPVRLIALKTWEFSGYLRKLASDASEIALGPDNRVYLLSQESATLIRLEKHLRPDEDKVSADRGVYWKLPAGMEKAEGLVIDQAMHPWVCVDIRQTDKANVFRLSPINAAMP